MAKQTVIQSPVSSTATHVLSAQSSSRIIGLMALVIVFNVIATEIENVKTVKEKASDKIGIALQSPFLIFAGGTVATVILLLAADVAGSAGEKFATGLAGTALLASVLARGSTVLNTSTNLFKKATTKGTPK